MSTIIHKTLLSATKNQVIQAQSLTFVFSVSFLISKYISLLEDVFILFYSCYIFRIFWKANFSQLKNTQRETL